MDRLPRAVVFVLIFSPILLAQGPRPSPSNTGFEVAATLSKDWNAKQLKVGDKVEAQVIQDVIVKGRVLIPRESKLVGHITGVETIGNNADESRLSLVFEEGRLKKGSMLNLQGVIEALGPPLAEPSLEAAMGSFSPYDPSTAGHPVAGPLGQSNATTPPMRDRWGDAGAQGLEERQRALDDARRTDTPAQAAQNHYGALSAGSRGVFGLQGLFLSHNNQGTSTIISVRKNVHLQSGSQIVVKLESVSGIATK